MSGDVDVMIAAIKRTIGREAFCQWARLEAERYEASEWASGRPVPDRRAEGIPFFYIPPPAPVPVPPARCEPESASEGAPSPPPEPAPAGPPAPFTLFENGQPVLEPPPGGWTARELAEAKRERFPDETDRGPRRGSLASRRF